MKMINMIMIMKIMMMKMRMMMMNIMGLLVDWWTGRNSQTLASNSATGL